MFHRTTLLTAALLSLGLALPAACGKDEPLAPKAEALEEAAPKSEASVPWTLTTEDAQVRFEMEAPFERQEGKVPSSAISGTLHLDLGDLTQSTGLIAVSIADLEIFMQKTEEAGKFGGEMEKDATQNEHMRDWLEIGDDAPADALEQNQRVQFSLAEVVEATPKDLTAMEGSERSVELTIKGEFLLHQRKTAKTVKLRATFEFEGDTPKSVRVETVEPFGVSLSEHDVRPRTGFGTLAKKTLGALSDKVAEQADVSVAFTATPAS